MKSPALLLALLGGGAALAVAASSRSKSSSAPERTSGDKGDINGDHGKLLELNDTDTPIIVEPGTGLETVEGLPAVSTFFEGCQIITAVFGLYTKKMGQLTSDEMEILAIMNARAKKIQYLTFADWIKTQTPHLDAPYRPTSADGSQISADAFPIMQELVWQYRRMYFLPPGANTRTGPDMYTEWANHGIPSKNGWEPNRGPLFLCSQYAALIECEPGHQLEYVGDPLCHEVDGPCHRGFFLDWFGRQIGTFDDENAITVYGTSDLQDIGEGLGAELKDLWNEAGYSFLRYVADIASNYPGYGTVVAAGITYLNEVGHGASNEDAAIAAGRAAVPETYRAMYDLGVGIAVKGEIDYELALDVAMTIAIQSGISDGEVIERFKQIKDAYESAKDTGYTVQGGLEAMEVAINVATGNTYGQGADGGQTAEEAAGGSASGSANQAAGDASSQAGSNAGQVSATI